MLCIQRLPDKFTSRAKPATSWGKRMSESIATNQIAAQALLAGILSAASMPLGSLTAFVWHPRNRTVAFMMAFGGGALLAALAIDLVGSATEKGHLLELAIGAIAGNLLYTSVNRIINNSGGFLRKPSTTLIHLTQQEKHRIGQRLSRLKHIDLFANLEPSFQQKIAKHLLICRCPKDTILYREGDPSESLYFIDRGEVCLQNHQTNSTSQVNLSANEMFGTLAFLTGSPHRKMAITLTDSKLDILPRSDFEFLLQVSPNLKQSTAKMLQSKIVADYLHDRQGLSQAEVACWAELAVDRLNLEGVIPPAIETECYPERFVNLAPNIRRFPIFKHLSQEDLEEIGVRLLYQQYRDGHIFFQPQEMSDRLFIIDGGEVEIVYPIHYQKPPIVLTSGDAFGELSFVTGAAHTVTAIAKSNTSVWIMRKQFFTEMLFQSPALETNVSRFLRKAKLKDYLQNRQNFEPSKAGEWVQRALKTMNVNHLIPSVTAMAGAVGEHKNAPMAIWLGLLMDGIPEALTIGAHLLIAPISPSLLVGLFIANYPEAFSSSEGMRQQGFSYARILIMWSSIMLVTGILAALGTTFFSDVPDSVISLLGSIAAGAMLTVISETMLPEAYAKGGSIVGISTILGFLVIILISSSPLH